MTSDVEHEFILPFIKCKYIFFEYLTNKLVKKHLSLAVSSKNSIFASQIRGNDLFYFEIINKCKKHTKTDKENEKNMYFGGRDGITSYYCSSIGERF
ncbi:MAG: hypothetical protein LBG80_09090 [Bacteroidales bacterium]|nr:hypothetical protein [Bacteroidales bacterium]